MKANVRSLEILMKVVEKQKYGYENHPSDFPNVSKKERDTRINRMMKLMSRYEIAKNASDVAINRETGLGASDSLT